MARRITGLFVWHDLFTPDIGASKAFYQRVANWRFVTEHADSFAWGGGAQDFVLALSGAEAGAGFVHRRSDQPDGWLPYVEVADVDAAVDLACGHGGTLVKRPFDVPGVGRNALLRDPAGALVGVSSSCHGFPPPTAQFGVERYVTQDGTFPDTFYNALFDWTKKQDGDIYRANTCIAACASHTSSAPKLARWVPSLRIHHLATDLKQMDTTGSTLMRDATGAAVYLVKA